MYASCHTQTSIQAGSMCAVRLCSNDCNGFFYILNLHDTPFHLLSSLNRPSRLIGNRTSSYNRGLGLVMPLAVKFLSPALVTALCRNKCMCILAEFPGMHEY